MGSIGTDPSRTIPPAPAGAAPAAWVYDAAKPYLMLVPHDKPSNGFSRISLQTFMWDLTDQSLTEWEDRAEGLVEAGAPNSAYCVLGSKAYAFAIAGAARIAEYDPALNTWVGVDTTVRPYGFYTAVADSSFIYLKGGYGSAATKFWKYSPGGGLVALADGPSCSQGVSIGLVGNTLWCAKGANSGSIYTYDIPTDTWSALPVTTCPANIYYCSTMGVVGTDLYVRTYTSGFYKYDTVGDVWTALTSPPGYFFDSVLTSLIHYDGSLIMAGTGVNYFAYNIAANAWTTVTLGLFKTGRGLVGFIP